VALYIDAIDLPIPIEPAFDCSSDFSRTVEWDPGMQEARRETSGEVRLASRVQVTVSFLGRRIPLEYRITEFERPSRLVLRGGDSSFRSIDEITFVARPWGTRLTYEARLELVGIRRIADPILDLLFQRIGRVAVPGVRERMADAESHEVTRKGLSETEPQSTARRPKRRQTAREVQSQQPKEGVI